MSDFDSPWKEALDEFFEAFVEFFFPQAHADIDWSRGVEFLDTELRQVLRDAEQGRRIVDKLAKVWRKDGHEDWVLAHVEIQGDQTDEFAERMFVCHYRIFDKYQRRVATLAVLADDRPHWRPTEYSHELWGCRVQFEFPIAKLLDLASDWSRLEASDNLFAVVVMAHLKTKETRGDPLTRYHWKGKLVRSLAARGWPRQRGLAVLRLIDWFLDLPKDLELQFRDDMIALQKEGHMPYVTSWERITKEEGRMEGRTEGRTEGLQTAIQNALDEKFGAEGQSLANEISSLADLELLQRILRAVVRAATLDEVRGLLK